ncbi:aminotransferase class III-fold pyridoxal phosphate-dependent enzyme [Thermogymnomonas acidicola]|uniref:aminotransferase class III-fold pyridoxal phosphate-dependent enzyme n=1 Tax=Thermogymnomonas acidicola TaxID=399579 RepID=UPI0014941BDB|nr:aminotransferase class III-fold pyridoxal phosphate-dependent enzyme [Thermogymnomonas acidicola]
MDECYTGFGKTGRPFSYQWFGIRPDILVIGKALGGGPACRNGYIRWAHERITCTGCIQERGFRLFSRKCHGTACCAVYHISCFGTQISEGGCREQVTYH